jgi:hypothetical protein
MAREGREGGIMGLFDEQEAFLRADAEQALRRLREALGDWVAESTSERAQQRLAAAFAADVARQDALGRFLDGGAA